MLAKQKKYFGAANLYNTVNHVYLVLPYMDNDYLGSISNTSTTWGVRTQLGGWNSQFILVLHRSTITITIRIPMQPKPLRKSCCSLMRKSC